MSFEPLQKTPGIQSLVGIAFLRGPSSPVVIKVNLTAVTDPTATDDANAGYSKGSIWINTATNLPFICANESAGAAIWKSASSTTSDPAGTVSGFASTTLTNANKTLTFAVDKRSQKLTGALIGPVVINVSRTGALEGARFRIILSAITVSNTNTLTVQENGAGSIAVFSDSNFPTVNGTIDLEFDGTAWVPTLINTVEK